jgi:hypothetical protein
MIVVLVEFSASGTPVLSLHADAVTDGWVQVSNQTVDTFGVIVARKIAAGTEDGGAMVGGITVIRGSSNCVVFATILRFTNSAGFAATPIEAVETSAQNGAGPLTGPSVAAGGTHRLAVSILGASGDGDLASTYSGASGGTWTERVDIGTITAGDAGIHVQDASLDGGGTISGGSMSVSESVTRFRTSFALVSA